jgi:eukaryotic-like serine/threonine-protein kinase
VNFHPAEHSGALYCAGCNARFVHALSPGVCPQCGAHVTVVPNDAFAETLLLKHLSGGTVAPEELAAAEEPDELLGGSLHVYRCESLLGCGAMGRVYLAHHEMLHRKCALKILSPRAMACDVDYVRRFSLEGRAAAALVHPNVVTTHAIGEERGYHFLEMEFVAGRTLQQLLHDEGRLTPVRATTLTARIADGLAAAHRAGIVHRDLKPDNVMLSVRGREADVVRVLDFGIAKLRDERGDVTAMPMTQAGDLLGTPQYMAPEQIRGEPVDGRTDVYALGAMLYEMVTGEPPFTGDTPVAVARHACG